MLLGIMPLLRLSTVEIFLTTTNQQNASSRAGPNDKNVVQKHILVQVAL